MPNTQFGSLHLPPRVKSTPSWSSPQKGTTLLDAADAAAAAVDAAAAVGRPVISCESASFLPISVLMHTELVSAIGRLLFAEI